MLKPISYILHTFLFLVLIGAIGSSVYYIKAAPGVTVTPAALSPTPTLVVPPTTVPTAFPTAETIVNTAAPGWTLLQPGLERRLIQIYNNQNQHVESLYIWRLDQKFFRLDVAYDETPKSLETWQNETNAALVVNGGYYSIRNEQYFPDGLTIANGKASGRSFAGFGGMLAIDQDRAELRWLAQKPYDPYERL